MNENRQIHYLKSATYSVPMMGLSLAMCRYRHLKGYFGARSKPYVYLTYVGYGLAGELCGDFCYVLRNFDRLKNNFQSSDDNFRQTLRPSESINKRSSNPDEQDPLSEPLEKSFPLQYGNSPRMNDKGRQMEFEKLPPDDIRALRECSRESLIYRGLPIALVGGLVIQFSRLSLELWPKLGLHTVNFLSSCLVGQILYSPKCKEKFLNLDDNSVLKQSILQKSGNQQQELPIPRPNEKPKHRRLQSRKSDSDLLKQDTDLDKYRQHPSPLFPEKDQYDPDRPFSPYADSDDGSSNYRPSDD